MPRSHRPPAPAPSSSNLPARRRVLRRALRSLPRSLRHRDPSALPMPRPRRAGILQSHHAFELGFEPTALSVPAPGTYAVRFVNNGAIYHDLTFGDDAPIGADPGQTVEGSVVVPAEGIAFICTVAGHGTGRHDRYRDRRGPPPSASRERMPRRPRWSGTRDRGRGRSRSTRHRSPMTRRRRPLLDGRPCTTSSS